MRELPPVFTRQTAIAFGYTSAHVRHRVKTGVWVQLRRGILTTRQLHCRMSSTSQGRHWLEVVAAITSLDAPAWASHGSARLLLGLPLLSRDGRTVTLTVEPASGSSRRYDGMHVMPAGVPPQHRIEVDGLTCLSAGRTVLDTLRLRPLADGLIVADAAVRHERTNVEQLHALVRDCAGWPGNDVARSRLPLIDGRRESPLESRSAAFFVETGLPMPEPQVDIYDDWGLLLGRCDFLWRTRRVIGEADGRTKYEDDLPGSRPREQRVWAERLRHELFEGAGQYEVVRWTHDDVVRRPQWTRNRIARAFDRAAERFHV